MGKPINYAAILERVGRSNRYQFGTFIALSIVFQPYSLVDIIPCIFKDAISRYAADTK